MQWTLISTKLIQTYTPQLSTQERRLVENCMEWHHCASCGWARVFSNICGVKKEAKSKIQYAERK